MYQNLPLDLTRVFQGSTYSNFGNLDAGILGFHSQIDIVIFCAEQIYLELQVINFKINEVTTNPKLQTLKEY